MTTPAQPRHARAEIRAFAGWLRKNGWVYQRTDSLGHTIWAHPKATGQYKLPETPRGFNLKRARGDIERLLGIKHQGKHRGKPKVSAPRRDFALEQALKQARARGPQSYTPPPKSKQARERDDRTYQFFDRLMREAPGGR